MSANSLVTGLHAFYLALAALVSLGGTAALVELIASLARSGAHSSRFTDFDVEDA